MKMKDLALAQVRRGERFTLDGVEFVKLEDDLDAAFAVAADTLPECCQFEDDDAEREDHNNYAGSLLSKPWSAGCGTSTRPSSPPWWSDPST